MTYQNIVGEIEYLRAVLRQEIVEAGEERTELQERKYDFLLNFFENMGIYIYFKVPRLFPCFVFLLNNTHLDLYR